MLSAAICLVAVALAGLTVLGHPPAIAAGPTLIGFASQTPTLDWPTFDPSTRQPTNTPAPPRPTRTPHPTWTPAPTGTFPPGEAQSAGDIGPIAAGPAGDSPLGLITSVPDPADVPEVALGVDLDYTHRWARVEQIVKARNTSHAAWSEVVFSIPLAALGGFALDAAAAGSPSQPASARLDGMMLHVQLAAPVQPGQLAQVELRYRIQVGAVSLYSSFPAGNNGLSGGVLRLGEWYPAIAPYRDGQGWETWQYQPIGDPTIYPATNTTLAVRAPTGVTVVSGGFYAHDGDVWRFRVQAARAMPIFASDQFHEVDGSAGNLPLRCFTVGEQPDAANAAIGAARDAISLYEDDYGPYPYQSLDIVENGYTGDMEYSALVSISDRAFSTSGGKGSLLMHTLLAHETAHQWWYGGVGNDQVYEPWLDEGLATYSESLYWDRYLDSGSGALLAAFRAEDLGTTIDFSIYDYPTPAQYQQALYPRAALFLDALRHTVGDQAFFDFLRDYQSRLRGKLATTSDFFATLRLHTNADLSALLDAYFSDPNR